MNPYTVYMQKEIFIFKKNILTSNLTPALFDELKLTTESYFVSPFFLVDFAKASSVPMVWLLLMLF